MTFNALKNAIALGRVENAVIFRDPESQSYELSVTFHRAEPRDHFVTFSLLSQRGHVRQFKTADAAFRVANDLGLDAVELCRDPAQEGRIAL